MENFKVRFLKYDEPESFIIGKVYEVNNGEITDETDYIFNVWSHQGKGSGFKAFKSWFEDNECEVELVKEEFTKSDLKDGMVLTYRNGEKRLLFLGNLYDTNDSSLLKSLGSINKYGESLTNYIGEGLDIIKVEYMGEILWEREKEYMTLEEAYKTGKKFKRKGINWWYTDPMEVLSNFVSETGKNMFEVLELKEFEIEES